MHVGVMGAGAIGGYLGGQLAAAGAAVTLVGRATFGALLATEGLTLHPLNAAPQTLPLSARLSYTTDPAALADCDAVLVCVKGTDTSAVAELLHGVLPTSALVVSFQNGLDNPARLRAALPDAVVLGGMVSFNVVRQGSVLRQATSGPVVFGEHQGRQAGLLAALQATGLPCQTHPDMPGILHGKLQFNLNNAINALCGLPLREQLSEREFRRLIADVMREGLAAQEAAGHRPRRLGTMMPRLAPWILPLPDGLFARVAGAMLQVEAGARLSMWDDLSRGKKTEIDQLNGVIVALGQQHGVPTPLNARIVALIRAAEDAAQGSPRLTAAQIRGT